MYFRWLGHIESGSYLTFDVGRDYEPNIPRFSSVGIVTGDRLISFGRGYRFPHCSWQAPNTKKISASEGLEILRRQHAYFEEGAKGKPEGFDRHEPVGPFVRAVQARRAFNLGQVVDHLDQGKDPQEIQIKDPQTGIYVVEALYPNMERITQRAAIKFASPVPDFELEKRLMKAIRARVPGIVFEGIRSSATTVYAPVSGLNEGCWPGHSSEVDLWAYRVYQIPESALSLVEDPVELDLEDDSVVVLDAA